MWGVIAGADVKVVIRGSSNCSDHDPVGGGSLVGKNAGGWVESMNDRVEVHWQGLTP